MEYYTWVILTNGSVIVKHTLAVQVITPTTVAPKTPIYIINPQIWLTVHCNDISKNC